MYRAPIRESGSSVGKRDRDIVKIQKHVVARIDRFEHGLFDGEECFVAKGVVRNACPLVRLSDKIADIRCQGYRRLYINTNTGEPAGWRDDRGCELRIMSDRSGYSGRPDGIAFRRPRYSSCGNSKFPAQGARDVAARAACLPHRQYGSLQARRFHGHQELLVPRLDRPYLADATRRQFKMQKAV